jgi:transcriptional regulatory protein LevR
MNEIETLRRALNKYDSNETEIERLAQMYDQVINDNRKTLRILIDAPKPSTMPFFLNTVLSETAKEHIQRVITSDLLSTMQRLMDENMDIQSGIHMASE